MVHSSEELTIIVTGAWEVSSVSTDDTEHTPEDDVTEDGVAEDDVEVEASKATAKTEIRDWLSTAFGELTVAPATCAPRYLAVTEMVCQVNREIRECQAIEAHMTAHKLSE